MRYAIYFILAVTHISLLGCFSSVVNSSISAPLQYKLTNGLSVIKWVNKSRQLKGQVTLRLVLNVGSLQERDNEKGYAHFVEHMAFNSTRDYPNESLLIKLKELGISMGKHTNAQTTFDSTIFWLKLNNPSPENLEFAVDLLAQWAMHVYFDIDVVNDEMPVVLEEWRLRQPTAQRWQAKQYSSVYVGSQYAERAPIGTIESIESVTAEKLQDFYWRWYRPDNAAIIVTGDFNTEKMQSLVDQKFSGWRSNDQAAPLEYDLSINSIARNQVFSDTHVHGGLVSLGYYVADSWPQSLDENYAALLWQGALDIFKYRLDKRLFATNGSVSDSYVKWERTSPNVLHIEMGAKLSVDDFETATRLLAQERTRLLSHGISLDELDNWRRETLLQNEIRRDSVNKLADVATNHFLYGSPLLDEEQWLILLRRRLPSLTPAAMNKAIRAMVTNPEYLTVVHNSSFSPPTKSQLSSWLTVETVEPIVPSKPVQGNISWPIKPNAKGEIISTRQLPQNVTEWTLGNGIVVWYQHNDQEPGKVYYVLSGEGGMDRLQETQILHARLALQTMSKSGLRNMDASTLRRWLSVRGMSQAPFYTFFDRGISGSGPSKYLDTLLRLLFVSLTEGRVDADAWRHYKSQNYSEITQLALSPDKAWFDALEATIWLNHAAFRIMTPQELEAIKPDDLMSVYRQHFTGTQNYRLAIVGDIAPAEARAVVLESIATLPVSSSGQSGISHIYPRAKESADVRIPGSGQQVAEVSLRYGITKTRLPVMSADKIAFLPYWLNEKLNNEIRERQGMVYLINTAVDGAALSQDAYTLIVQFSCDPERVESVIASVEAVLHGAADTQPSSKQLHAWRHEQSSSWEGMYKTPKLLSSVLARSAIRGLSARQVLDIEKRSVVPSAKSMTNALSEMLGPHATRVSMVRLP